MVVSLWRGHGVSSALNVFTNALRRLSSEAANTIPREARESMMYSDINSQISSCMPFSTMRIGTIIHNIELNPGQGGKQGYCWYCLQSNSWDRKLRKVGHSRWLGRRPVVRGVTMNPVDHPHGGGEGKSKSSGQWGKGSRTPWGKPTKRGYKTGPLKGRR